MADLEIKPAETSRERRAFLELPWIVNKAYPNWIPPLRQNQEELVHYKPHPFYKTAEVQTFVAWQGGQPIGRIAAIANRAHNQEYKDQLGFFGFFDCIDDQPAAHSLFDAAREWLRSRNLTAIRGPVNPSLNHECGLLIDGFQTPPFFMMTHNPPYYQRLIESYGFAKVEDMAAFWGHVDMLKTLDKKVGFITEECRKRFNVQVRRLDKKRFNQDVRLFLDIYNRSLVGTWGFVPMSDDEVDHMAASLKYLIAPEMTAIVEVDGQPIGATFGMLDYNPRIKLIDGKLFPFGFLRLLMNKRAIKRIRVISTNVLPEFQKWGLGLVVLAHLIPSIHDWGIEEVEFSWVLESNHLSYKTLKRGGALITKTYRLFDYAIPAAGS